MCIQSHITIVFTKITSMRCPANVDMTIAIIYRVLFERQLSAAIHKHKYKIIVDMITDESWQIIIKYS